MHPNSREFELLVEFKNYLYAAEEELMPNALETLLNAIEMEVHDVEDRLW